VDPAAGVNIDVSQAGQSPHGTYTVTATPVGGASVLADITVTRTSDPQHTVLVHTQAAFWGFSPDDDRFVAHYVQDPGGSSIHHIALYNLVGSSPGVPVWPDPAVSTASDRIQFSPSGRYLFYAYIFNGQTNLQIVDAQTGVTRFTTAFTPTTVAGSGDDEFGVAGWGFGPNDSRFVYAWNSASTTVEWNIVNLERAPGSALVKTVPIINDVSAFWQFSPCGDVIALVHQPSSSFADVDVYNTADGTSAGSGASIPAPFQLITLNTTANWQVATNTTGSGSTDYTLGPNNAAASCGGGTTSTTSTTSTTTTTVNQPPTARFTLPSGVQAGVAVTFHDASTDPDGSIAHWAWSFGDGQTSTDQNPIQTYTDPAGGTYTVSLTVTDNNGATNTVTHSLVVSANAPPHASFTFSPNPPSRGDMVTFTDTSTDDDGIVQESWIIDNNFYDGPTASVKACEPFDAQLTVYDYLYQSDTATETIVVSTTGRVIVVPPGASLADAISTACPGDTVSLGAGTYTGGVTLDGINLEGVGAGLSIVSGAPDPAAQGWVLTTRGQSDISISNLSVRDGSGGIYADTGGTTKLDHVEVDHNVGLSGVFADCCDTNLEIDHSSIHHNQALEQFSDRLGGAGIQMYCCGDVTVTNSEIAYNTSAGDGGGAEPFEADKVVFIGNYIHDNIAAGEGGGVLVDSFGAGDVFANNRFLRNSADTGGALTLSSKVLVAGNLIAQNVGGGIQAQGSGRVVIINATIVDNTGTGVDGSDFGFGDVWVYNSIVGGNTTDLDSSSSSCGRNLIGTTHLPAFADADYHLAAGSVAIDAGDNSVVPSELATDADGQARIQDGNGDGTATVDLGYDEFQGFGGTGGAGSIPTTCEQPAPPNDDFANAEELSGNTGTVEGTNVGGTAEAGEPDHAGSTPTHSVWYAFTPGAGSVTVDTLGSGFDTVLGVYTGADVAHLTEVTSNDDADGSTVQSQVTFDSVVGTTYWIAVDGHFDGSSGETGDIVLNWAFTATGGANHAPTCSDLSLTTNEDTAGSVPPACSDSDGDTLTYSIADQPQHGAASIGSAGELHYAPDAHFSGTDSFTYKANDGTLDSNVATVSVTVDATNEPPVVDAASIDQSSAKTNDTLTTTVSSHDPNGDPVTLSYQWFKNGSLLAGATGSSLNLSVAGNGGKGDSITVSVTPNDGTVDGAAMTSAALVIGNTAPEAAADSGFSTNEDTALAISAGSLLANDSDADGDTLSVASVGGSVHGSVSVSADHSTIAFTPAAGYTGAASFTYQASDGTDESDSTVVSLTVNRVNHAPVVDSVSISPANPKTNDTLTANPVSHDVDGDAVNYTYQWLRNGSVLAGATSSSLNLGTVGNGDKGDSIAVRVTGHDATLASAPVTSAAVLVGNTAPTCSAVALVINENAVGNVAPTCADVDLDVLTFSIVSGASHGTASVVAGRLQYMANANYHGNDSFTYRASDGSADSSAATVSITVTPVAAAAVCTVTGNGQTGANKRFTIAAKLRLHHAPTGSVHYDTRTVHFASTSLTSIACINKRATIVGVGAVNHVRVTFTLIVTDGLPDRFALSWAGFNTGGAVTRGKIKVTTRP
jgi:PKD repeat protein